MNGFSKFDPFPIEGPYAKQYAPDEKISEVTDNINRAVASIREWQTLMNIMGFNSWQDPLTKDIHIVIRHGKMREATHIGEAAEIVK